MSVPDPRRPDHDRPGGGVAGPGPSPRVAPTPEQLEEIHRWATAALIARDVAEFGTSAWCALPDGPTKVHAAVRAALAWWTEQWARADAAAQDHVDASHAISGAEDWRRVGLDLLQRSSRRIPRRN